MPCRFLEQSPGTEEPRLFAYGRAVFLSADASLASELTLPECWNASGSLVFLGEDFSPALSARLTALWRAGLPRFVWLGAEGVWTLEPRGQVLADAQVFGFGPYRLVLSGGLTVECGEDEFRFLPSEEANTVSLAAPGVVLRSRETARLVVGGSLSPEGGCAGTLVFSASGDPNGKNLFALLDASLSFAAPLDSAAPRRERLRSGFTARLECAPFSLTAAVLSCQINPASLYDQDRTFLSLPPETALETAFRTPEGRKIQGSTGAGARLVFQRRALRRHHGGVQTRPYLGFSGEFRLQGDAPDLLCGLAGTEFLHAPASIRLCPDGGAYLPGSDQGLSDQCTASYLQPLGETSYCTQAEQSPFFAPAAENRLSFLPLALRTFSGDEEAPAVPLLPYSGARLHPPGRLSLPGVEKVLSETRLARFASEAPEVREGTAERIAISSRGLLAGFSGEGTNAALTWAAFGNTGTAPSSRPELRVEGIRRALRAELQSVRPCACYESAQAFSDAASVDSEGFGCTVCGWKLRAAPQHWRENTALLFKYGTEGSLLDRFPDSAALRDALSAAHDETGEVRPNCQELVDTIRSSAFQGLLILNCPVSVDPGAPGYRAEWSFLVDSLDREKLCATYFIVYHSEAVLRDGTPVINPSRFSAYVDYQDPVQTAWDENRADFRFQTVGLQVVLRNGAVESLESQSELLLGRLFGSPCHESGAGQRGLILDGRFLDGVQRFSLREPGNFQLTGSALERVDVENILCAADETSVRFLLGGQLHFQSMEADLFSYGGTEEQPGGLRFEGLILTRNAGGSMSMSYGGLTLRTGDSVPRPNSLCARFPAAAGAFRTGTAKQPPETLGFVSMRSPLRQGAISGDWFGLEYRVPLGGLGSMSSEDGPELTLLFAWQPGEAQPSLYTGVRLASAAWKLQGLFEMGFSSVGLDVDTSGETPRYYLTMEQFALRLLGIALPPGQNRLFLFAGEDGRELGWYAAYQNKPKEDLSDGG